MDHDEEKKMFGAAQAEFCGSREGHQVRLLPVCGVEEREATHTMFPT